MALMRRNQPRDVTGWSSGMGLSSPFIDMRREIDRLFDRMLEGSSLGESALTVPPVDILEEDHQYVVKAELPGVNSEDVKITLQDDVLSIRGEKRREERVEEKNYHRLERSAGIFQRSFTLPSAVKSDQIEASFENGILTVTIPKAEDAKPREIEVKIHGGTQEVKSPTSESRSRR
jgi:HSP20 family protein